MRSIIKLTWRTVRSFFGRYMALLLITALSVGFFSGLKITGGAMRNTCGIYLTEQNLYDFRLISTLGFTGADVDELSALPSVSGAEGMCSADAMIDFGGEAMPFTLLSLPETVNLPSLTAGRMPENKNECLGDAKFFHENDIGSCVALSDENERSTLDRLDCGEMTLVGLARSPLYIGINRGTTSIGSGTPRGFLYLPIDAFAGDVYSEVDLTLSEDAEIYSDEYDELIEKNKSTVSERCAELAEARFDSMLAEAGVTAELAEQVGIDRPETYVLTRDENSGYVSFENDSTIVSGIANIFPVFFIVIAMLVCITTMTRMVEEERTQSGVLKAMGYSELDVTCKYLLYAGSATVIGWAVGFFLGTWGLPKVFWYAYSSLYSFAPMKFMFSPFWAALTLTLSLTLILGSTWLSCRGEMHSPPSMLIRPRPSKSGKRVLLERAAPIWSRLTFLQKITVRNMFRYKQRLVMMLVGIGCCAGLVVTAFGVRDSMMGIGTLQFETVQKYDLEAGFAEGDAEAVDKAIDECGVEVERSLGCAVHRMDLTDGEERMTVKVLSFADSAGVSDFWSFRSGERELGFPAEGEAMVNLRVAERFSLSVGDTLEIEDSDMRTASVTVSGIFDSYVDNYAVLSRETYENAFGEAADNTILLTVPGGAHDEAAEALTEIPEVTSVVKLSDTRDAVDRALDCLNYVIWIVVLFSGALAFIVIFNLTNINLAERSREVATVEVLGFYPRETYSYVLRENLILSALASVIGLPLGYLFHRAVMRMIVIDFIAFDIRISALSYVLALLCTLFFASAVNLFMRRQIGKIKMAESLKAVE